MPRTIAPGIIFFLALLGILAVPGAAIGYFGLSNLGMPASIIVGFLAGFVIGTVKRAYFEDNITTFIISLILIAGLQFFLILSFWQTALIYLVGYLVGRRLEVVDVHDPFHV